MPKKKNDTPGKLSLDNIKDLLNKKSRYDRRSPPEERRQPNQC